MKMRVLAVWERLRASYWFVPSLMAVAAGFLSLALVRLDQVFEDETLLDAGWIYAGGAEGARAVLSVIAGSIITVAGTTFSITVAALSLASSQFGPRLLRNFMRDTGNQVVLGAFTSTFLYCILVLRTVQGVEDHTNVPHISVTAGVVLAVFCVGVLIYFIHHVAESIQASRVIENVSQELDDSVMRLFPEVGQGDPEDAAGLAQPEIGGTVVADAEGYIQTIDAAGLLRYAAERGARIHLLVRPGDYLIAGRPIARIVPEVEDVDSRRMRQALTLGRVRTPVQDAEIAFLQLVEIAVRALSPSVNDPFTAVMCVDRITSALCRLADRTLPGVARRDPQGEVRLVAPRYEYEDLADAAYRHIRESSDGFSLVRDRLRASIARVLEHAKQPAFRAALLAELGRIP